MSLSRRFCRARGPGLLGPGLLALGLGSVLAPAARAASPETLAQEAELDRVRAQVADEIQLSVYDLIDELVVGWARTPVFDKPTPVVVAGVSVPVGLGTGLQALMENHLANVVGANPATNVQLVHCPACTAVIVHSGPEATVISRGIDDPATLQALAADAGRYALFVDVEAEGSWLVLRARLTRLTPDLPIVWSRTLSSSTATPALLREAHDLKTAEEARDEYLNVLEGRGSIVVPLRFAIRTFSDPEDEGSVGPPPLIWIQSGVEIGTTEGRTWTSSLMVGYSFLPQAYQGVMIQGRVSRLLSGRTRSLTGPNLYGFVGGGMQTLWGPSIASFADDTLTVDEIITAVDGDDPRTSFPGLHAGLDLRLGDRIGFSSFLETVPTLRNNSNLGDYVNIGGLGFQSWGVEVSFCF